MLAHHLLVSLGIVGILLLYQYAQKPGHLLHWWRKVFTKYLPKWCEFLRDYIRHFSERLSDIETFKVDDLWLGAHTRAGAILYIIIWYLLIIPIIMIGGLVLFTAIWLTLSFIYSLRKIIALCPFCQAPWVAILIYLCTSEFEPISMIIFVGFTFNLMLIITSVPRLKKEFK